MMGPGDKLHVVGHRRPDLDSVAAAIGYAMLLGRAGADAVGYRCGPLDEQSVWALERFGLEPPPLLLEAAPTFGSVARSDPALPPTASLAEVVARIAGGMRAVPVADEAGRAVGLVDARACVHILGRAGAGQSDSLAAIREGAARADAPVMSEENADAIGPALVFSADERLSDRRAEIVRGDPDDFLVVGTSGSYLGIASRSSILAPPRMKLVLVDHNELGQSVPGAEQADIVEVLDHHRLGNASTLVPIPFSVDIVGSTATLVEERWRQRGQQIPVSLAGVLLSAILSDTLAFRSPTCTRRDHEAARRLAEAVSIADVAGFGLEVVTAGAGFGQRSGAEIVQEDFKEYDLEIGPILVAQAEVRTLHEINGRVEDLTQALEQLRASRAAVLAILLLTDPVRGASRLIALGEPRWVAKVPYARGADGLWDAGPVVSRKTQLIPALLSALAP